MNRYVNSFLNSFSTKLETPVKEHLKNVYGTLAMTTTSAVVGSYVNSAIGSPAGLLTSIGGLIALITLCMTPDNGKNLRYRLGLLLGFAFLSGLNLGPVLELALIINPAIIQTALIGTIAVFVSFTMSAIYSSRGSWLYLGGILGSILSSMLLLSLANLFFRSAFLSSAHLYLGLAAMCAFILFDTQAIIEKRRAGSKDFISHSLDLFIDVLQVFRHLMVVLMDKEERRQKKKN